MNVAATRRQTGSFLPDINNKHRGTTSQLRLKQQKTSLRSNPAPDKPAQIISKKEVARFRYRPDQFLCVETLQDGFHRSFADIFFLLSSDRGRRAAAEPGSALRSQTPLQDQQEKLETMRLHLTRAEQAERTGSWSSLCEQRWLLGRYFSAPEDVWLSLHFHHSCADREHGGRSRPATEARACLAELYLQKGDLEEARQQAELCVKQAEDGGWLDPDGRPMMFRVCRELWRIYSRIADASLAASRSDEALALLHKSYSISTECEDKQMEGEVAYQLGLTYQSVGDHDTAKQFFNSCMQICGTLEDPHGLVKAYRAMAQSLESEGQIDETIQCLETLADMSRISGLQDKLADACLCQGNIYCARSQYVRGCEFFQLGYDVACSIEDVTLLQKAQVLLAGARSRCLVMKHMGDAESSSNSALRRLLDWGDNRGRQDASTEATSLASATSQ
ncbi:tetratricopeptide repeat protein 29 isoform X2 [Mugil cephalus]|uniref:tetratricopeptide repeat protein 29 isoform X2 n=1 Tax=Mugil cephalus TaxID=48193 RepID=UPI001FB77506|nr:tetratricopeptide repeat protein 29 isoform X2 [Mugil cephalus]